MESFMKSLNVFKLESNATLPTKNHPNDAGHDLYSLEDVFIPVGSTAMVKTGVAIQIEPGEVGRLAGRSSMNRRGLITAPGVIDTGYSGDISITINNFSCRECKDYSYKEGYLIKAGDKIAQILIEPILIKQAVEVDKLWTSERGSRGFGSSGR